MGAIQDKMSNEATFKRQMNEVEFERLRGMAVLEEEKNKKDKETEREKLEMEKQKASADYQLRKGEMILKFQTDIRKIEADLFQTRLKIQSTLFEKFLEYMRQTLDTNAALIEQQKQLYILVEKSSDEKKVEYFMKKADDIHIMQPKDLMDVGLAKVKELNLDSSEEVKYLAQKIEEVVGTIQQNTTQFEAIQY